jgi:hypothetical protein
MNAIALSGIAFGPGSDPDKGNSVYLSDRGVDNARNPSENDGRVYELRIEAGPPPNLVANPGMEVDQDRDGTADSWDDEVGASLSRDNARSGRASLRMEAGTAQVVVSQGVPSIDASRAYTFVAWVDVPPGDVPLTLRVRIRWRDAADVTLETTKVAVLERSTSGWDKVTAALRSPPRATSATITFSLEGPGSVAFVDDVLLVTTIR